MKKITNILLATSILMPTVITPLSAETINKSQSIVNNKKQIVTTDNKDNDIVEKNNSNNNLKVDTTVNSKTKVTTNKVENEAVQSRANELVKVKEDNYATIIKKGLSIYSDLNTMEKKSSTTDDYYKQTVKNTGYYLINGKKYYSLRTNEDKWIGYIESSCLNFSNSEKGRAYHYSITQYATISKKGWRIWKEIAPFDTVTYKSEQLYGKTFKVSDVHYHFNGNTYVLLNNQNGKVIGYSNVDALKLTSNSYGKKISEDNYASINSKSAPIYDSLKTMHQVTTTSKIYLDTVKNSGYYITYNGRKYYSLYDNNEKWIGYVESKYLTISDKACGINRKYSTAQYATIKKKWLENMGKFITI